MIKKTLSGILTFLIAMLAVSPVYATANGTIYVTFVKIEGSLPQTGDSSLLWAWQCLPQAAFVCLSVLG